MTTRYEWPWFFLDFDAETGETMTYFPDGARSGCTPVPEDAYHGTRLGITPAEHRLLHELCHHAVGIYVMHRSCSPVIWRDAYHVPQPNGDGDEAQLEEWLVTALTYFICGLDPDDYGALIDISHHISVTRLARLVHWLFEAPSVGINVVTVPTELT